VKQHIGFIDKKLNVLALIALYSFIVIAHLYYLPNINQSTQRAQTAQNSIVKRRNETINYNQHLINYLHRTDKFTLNDKKSVNDFISSVIGCFILLLFTLQLWKLNLRPFRSFTRYAINHQFVYLSLRTFRI